jgi:plasmid stabilization system protein ParE
MKIDIKESFMHKLEAQVDFIAKDSPQSARKFKNELIRHLKSIGQNPYQFRKSVYFDEQCIRDLIFKGYTIIFRINDNVIEVFGFVKYQNSPL